MSYSIHSKFSKTFERIIYTSDDYQVNFGGMVNEILIVNEIEL